MPIAILCPEKGSSFKTPGLASNQMVTVLLIAKWIPDSHLREFKIGGMVN